MKLEKGVDLLAHVIHREQGIINDLEKLAECNEFPAKSRMALSQWAKVLNQLHYSSIAV